MEQKFGPSVHRAALLLHFLCLAVLGEHR